MERENEAPAPPATSEAGCDSSESPRKESATPASAVKDRPAPPRVDRMPPWKVLLHNDEVNEMLYVVGAIMELCALPRTRAVHLMLEAHTRGVALLMVTHKERAELLQEQFRSKGLTVTIEPEA